MSNHPKVILEFLEKKTIFDDVRNFGKFEIYSSENELLEKNESIRTLGIHGLAQPFQQKEFENLLNQKRNLEKMIGSLLLDQRLVAGVGNIYKSESLFKANLHPVRPVKSLTSQEITTLGKSISEILNFALNCGGSTIENFQSPNGSEGKAQEWHQVYGRENKNCYTCNTFIRRLIQNTRSTFFCPTCQPLPDGLIVPEELYPVEKTKAKKKSSKSIKKKRSSKK
jgi:formamidopyrimidine-DNA glycosylase